MALGQARLHGQVRKCAPSQRDRQAGGRALAIGRRNARRRRPSLPGDLPGARGPRRLRLSGRRRCCTNRFSLSPPFPPLLLLMQVPSSRLSRAARGRQRGCQGAHPEAQRGRSQSDRVERELEGLSHAQRRPLGDGAGGGPGRRAAATRHAVPRWLCAAPILTSPLLLVLLCCHAAAGWLCCMYCRLAYPSRTLRHTSAPCCSPDPPHQIAQTCGWGLARTELDQSIPSLPGGSASSALLHFFDQIFAALLPTAELRPPI